MSLEDVRFEEKMGLRFGIHLAQQSLTLQYKDFAPQSMVLVRFRVSLKISSCM